MAHDSFIDSCSYTEDYFGFLFPQGSEMYNLYRVLWMGELLNPSL
jgi:hypothetical protein